MLEGDEDSKLAIGITFILNIQGNEPYRKITFQCSFFCYAFRISALFFAIILSIAYLSWR